MKQNNQLGYCLHIGSSSVLKHKALSITSIVTTTACLLLISFTLMLSINIGYNMKQFQVDNVMLAFVDDALSTKEAMELAPSLRSVAHITNVTFISKEEAFEDYATEYEDAATEHLQPSVFRDRYAVEIDDQRATSEVVSVLLAIPGIADTRVDETVSEGFAVVKSAVTLLGGFVGALLLGISVIIMTNMIKTTTFARQAEIAVMKMMGAYDDFIRLPFILEGCIVGLSGALAAFVLSLSIYTMMGRTMRNIGIASLLDVLPFSDMAYAVLAVDLVLGLGVGITGSAIALRRYLKV